MVKKKTILIALIASAFYIFPFDVSLLTYKVLGWELQTLLFLIIVIVIFVYVPGHNIKKKYHNLKRMVFK